MYVDEGVLEKLSDGKLTLLLNVSLASITVSFGDVFSVGSDGYSGLPLFPSGSDDSWYDSTNSALHPTDRLQKLITTISCVEIDFMHARAGVVVHCKRQLLASVKLVTFQEV